MLNKRGFTLIEVLLVVVLMSILFIFSFPYSLKFYRTYLVDEVKTNVVTALNQARHYAILQKNDSDFGVNFNEAEDNYVLFQGSSYATRDITQDEVFPVLNIINFSGLSEIVFSKHSGLPSITGDILISYENISRTINISESGIISEN